MVILPLLLYFPALAALSIGFGRYSGEKMFIPMDRGYVDKTIHTNDPANLFPSRIHPPRFSTGK